MAKKRDWIILSYFFLAATVFISAQTRKAGLWDVTSTTTIQQRTNSPGTSGTDASPAQSSAPPAPIPMCLTQSMIDKYGVFLPPSLRDCELSHVVQKPNSFLADLSCKGSYNGTGSIETTWADDEHAVGKIHFVSKTKNSANAISLRWTQDGTAVFKSADCGTIRPRAVPAAKNP
jgi:hypothetical protein